MSGQRNKLCVSSLCVGDFADGVEALYGMFDGDRNEEVPRLLQCTMGDVLLEEIQQSNSDRTFMCHTFLVSHRKLGTAGQKLGSSALLCYIGHSAVDHSSSFTLTVANVGTCQAVLCRNGQPLSLSRMFTLEHCPEDLLRIKEQKAIITEDNKVNGVTCCTRLLGSTYLHPWVIPQPHISTTSLCVQDELLIVGSKALWEYVSPTEAVKTICHLPDPLAAAKKLCTLAQSYGCQDNVAALVICLNIGEDACTCEMHTLTLPSPSGLSSTTTKESPDSVTPSSSSGIASEFSSEMSVSEVSSEVGSTASDDHAMAGIDGGLIQRPERRCSLHPVPSASIFQRQPSCATFSSNQSDNGLDSDDDDLPSEGMITNGTRVEVEVDIHCIKHVPESSVNTCQGPDQDCEGACCQITGQNHISHNQPASSQERDDMNLSGPGLYMKKHSNGSVVPLEEILNLIEIASEAPKRKTGYFSAPSQMEPDDQFVMPHDLEQEVREQVNDIEPTDDRATGHEEFDTAL